MKIAIVTTVKDDVLLDGFLAYHFSVGFDHVFVFFDDEMYTIPDRYLCRPNVTAVKRDKRLIAEWKRLKAYRHFEKFLDVEPMARQPLNVNIAIGMAAEMGIDWLLHIDADELFYSPEMPVKEHFEALSENKIERSLYYNHEAIPERMDVKDVFSEVNLFRKNRKVMTEEQAGVLEKYSSDNEVYFNFYANGKSATRISRHLNCRSCHIVGAVWWKEVQLFLQKKSMIQSNTFPGILHYSCCNFDAFWQKYKVLGKFKDHWFDMKREIKDILPMHVLSRDVYQASDVLAGRMFYEEHFINKPLRNREIFEKAGVFFRASRFVKDSIKSL
jgi:hypothetical protein